MMRIKQKLQSERLSKLLIALTLLCLSLLLIGCGSTQTEYVTLHQPTDPDLLADIQVPMIPDPLSFGDSVDLNIELISKLGQCNVDKRALREIEALRAKQLVN